MRLSRLLIRTLRDAPAGGTSPGEALLMRAGYVRLGHERHWQYLPLGARVLERLEARLRAHLDAAGGQPLDMLPGEEMAALMAEMLGSYRQLPLLVYRVRHTARSQDDRSADHAVVANAFDLDEASRERSVARLHSALSAFLAECELDVVVVDDLVPGVAAAQQVVARTSAGRHVVVCSGCGYAATPEAARFARPEPVVEAPLPLEDVATPNAYTIRTVSELLDVPRACTAKVVFLVGDEVQVPEVRVIVAVLRGDMELSVPKLARVVGARSLRPASADEVRRTGAEPGYASPVGLTDAIVVADDLVVNCSNLVAGGNREGYHVRNVNYGRDYVADIVADIAAVSKDGVCQACSSALTWQPGTRLATVTQFDPITGPAFGVSVLAADGATKYVLVTGLELYLHALLASLACQHRDEHGLVWPRYAAPYDAHLVSLADGGAQAGTDSAEWLYAELQRSGVRVLYDDRDARAGVKFNDADLIGLPIRVTVGPRGVARGEAEVTLRASQQAEEVPFADVVVWVAAWLRSGDDERFATQPGRGSGNSE